MKRVAVTTGFALLLVCTTSHAQSAAVTPPGDAAPASQTSCVILKRMGRMGRTESRLTHFGISGKQFRYVEGKLPEGFSFREKMNGNNVRNLQARGVQVLVLDSHYTADDLKEARAGCQRGSGKAASQVEAKASPAPAPAAITTAPTARPAPATESIASTSAPAAKPPAANATSLDKASSANASTRVKAPSVNASTSKTDNSAPSKDGTEAALVDVSSTPPGADVYIDENFFGRTPATTIILTPGNHRIAVKKSGFVVWEKKMKLPSGPTNVNAELFPKSK